MTYRNAKVGTPHLLFLHQLSHLHLNNSSELLTLPPRTMRTFASAVITLIALTVSSSGNVLPTLTTEATSRTASLWRHRQLLQAQEQLVGLKRALVCKRRVEKKVAAIEAKVKDIRKCLYNGLSFRKYAAFRKICRNRSEILNLIRHTRKTCRFTRHSRRCTKKLASLRNRRNAVSDACSAINWTGQKRACPKLNPLLEELKDTRNGGCGSPRSIENLQKDVRRIHRRVKYLLGIVKPKPSVLPRAA